MIPAEYIIIGDIFRVNRDGLCIKKGTLVKVTAVDALNKLPERGLIGSVHCHPLDDEQLDGGIWCDYLDPVPLTSEILEKNRFLESKAVGWQKEWKICPENYGRTRYITNINCINGGFDFGDYRNGTFIDYIHIRFIHELHHALKLCEIQKEIIMDDK